MLAIGDSVMLGATAALKQQLPDVIVDAKVGRYITEGIDIVRRYKARGQLPPVVVVQLGNNGPIDEKELTTYHPDARRIMTAYVAGVNAFLDVSQVRPVEFNFMAKSWCIVHAGSSIGRDSTSSPPTVAKGFGVPVASLASVFRYDFCAPVIGS